MFPSGELIVHNVFVESQKIYCKTVYGKFCHAFLRKLLNILLQVFLSKFQRIGNCETIVPAI